MTASPSNPFTRPKVAHRSPPAPGMTEAEREAVARWLERNRPVRGEPCGVRGWWPDGDVTLARAGEVFGRRR